MNTNILVEKIVNWLQIQVQTSNSKGLLVGVSGGIDSAVVAHLIKRACPQNSLGVILPINSSSQSLSDANKLIKQCNIKSITIELTDIHSLMISKIFDQMSGVNLYNDKYRQISDANLRARLRMSTLYTIANNLGYMVVGTDNKDETYTGYFTKYGDGGVDIMPIANIFKSEIYKMAEIFKVPTSIISKAPSADLWKNQTDEEEMGVKYDQIEKYIRGEYVDDRSKKIIEKLHTSSEHKRKIPPKFEY